MRFTTVHPLDSHRVTGHPRRAIVVLLCLCYGLAIADDDRQESCGDHRICNSLAVSLLLRSALNLLNYSRVVAFSIIRLRSLHRAQDLIDFDFEYVQPEIWAQIELHYGLMAATIPCLHIFLKNLQTGWLADLKDRPDTAIASKLTGNRYNGLSLVRSEHSMGRSSDRGDLIELQDWTDRKAESRTFAQRTAKSDDAASDGSGRRILVRKTVDISHTTMED